MPPSDSRRTFAGLGALALFAAACNPEPALVRDHKANEVAADIRLDFKRAADASNLAVMGDTEETSAAFAKEAEVAMKSVRERAAELGPLLRGLGYEEETATFEEFLERLTAYEAVDKTVLELAVANTNLKAQRLAFDAGRDEANTIRDALDSVSKATPPSKACEIAALVAKVVIAVREVQVLEHPHIAEADDAVMDRMEKEMSALQGVARTALRALADTVDGDAGPDLSKATAALGRFEATHTSIVALSRTNSNVRSSKLSLGEKRGLASACEASLEALATALAKRSISPATR